jgi:transposase
MRIMYGCCAGLDVHKETVQCCVRRVEPDGGWQETVRQFGTMTDDLLEMVESLKAQRVTRVAMESTGVFGKPIDNLLEEHFSIVLVNPAHCKQVPGRKTDGKDWKDCQWLAELLQYGL